MTISYSPTLLHYMKRKGKRNIAIEVMSSDHSDFDITELYIHFIRDHQVAYYRDKKKFHVKETEAGLVLLPNYRLSYEPEIVFDWKKGWFGIRHLVCHGVKL